MAKKIDDFSNTIIAKIRKYQNVIKQDEIGNVISIGDGIAFVSGLENVMLNELVLFENGTKGMALDLDNDFVGVILLGKYDDIHENSIVKRTKEVVSVPVGDKLLGRVIDSLGKPLDNNGILTIKKRKPIENLAPDVISRSSVNTPLETGILSIDSMFPIGKGQRELIIGDRQTGKTSIAIDAILNQKGKNVKCIYVGIGQKESSIANIYDLLNKEGAMKYTTIISASASALPALIYIAPYAGMTIAEEWLNNGDDVLIIFDDLSKHAISYRTISLLLHRPPGREAYPGDIFYLHSRLLERAGKVNIAKNVIGSITALPIVETQAGDISAYIPTNIISITDGQLFLSTSMFNNNQRPAIDTGLSVSRIGSNAQKWYIKQLSSGLKLKLAQFNELRTFVQFGTDLDKQTKEIINQGQKIELLLKQDNNMPLSSFHEALLLFVIKNDYIKWIPFDKFIEFRQCLFDWFKKIQLSFGKSIKLDEKIIGNLDKNVKEFIFNFVSSIPNYDQKIYGNINDLK